MRLQRLELNGFKSFPERSHLAFDTGVTAIVGPNGCGKSNLVDAITWVLGEQSAKSLRGDRMEDVIFSGSDARKPTAAAEVKLRLSGVTAGAAFVHNGGSGNGTGNGNGHGNGHGHGQGDSPGSGVFFAQTLAGEKDSRPLEPAAQSDLDDDPCIVRDVELSRRLYRSGESEYLIDGEVCRLRDVQDLLMDAGMGTKGYAVIEQGKIGQILSARASDRRLLIEEAAGVTKYKTRRRTAELKLEAARQNLTRIDDIVFEVEKQRNALKRQAAKARRYRRLRDELRRWEKVMFARRHRTLAQQIESARTRLDDARLRETAASARVAEVESDLERLRLELAGEETRATAARDAAHQKELEIERRQQQIQGDRQHVGMLESAASDIAAELRELEGRRGPGRTALAAKQEAAGRAETERIDAARVLAEAEAAYASGLRGIEGLEGDVEAARSEVFAALNAATALRHVVEHAGAARLRLAEALAKLEAEASDVRREAEKAAADRDTAAKALGRAQAALEATQVARSARESELASARIEREWRHREARIREHEVATLTARLKSLQELDAARAGYADAARLVLKGSGLFSTGSAAEKTPDPDAVGHHGSIADHLEVTRGYERAVEAFLGDLLQHVIVDTQAEAEKGLRFVREQNAGRCGFLVVEGNGHGPRKPAAPRKGTIAVSSVARVRGPFGAVIGEAMGDGWIAKTFAEAATLSEEAGVAVVTPEGDVFRGSHVVQGGLREEARGILATKAEINDLHQRIAVESASLDQLSTEVSALETTIAQAELAIGALAAEQHRHEKAIVGFELQLAQAAEEADRQTRKLDVIGTERRSCEEERSGLTTRETEARDAIQRLEQDQLRADERFAAAQRRLFDGREAAQMLSQRAAETKAAHAALVERAAALAAEVERLNEAAGELEARVAGRAEELDRTKAKRTDLLASIAASELQLTHDLRAFDALRDEVRAADERLLAYRGRVDHHETLIREARRTLEETRSGVGQLEVARATATSDLSHLEASCLESLQMTLADVTSEVAELEQQGEITPDPGVICADEPEPDEEGAESVTAEPAAAPATPAALAALSAEDAIATLKIKIERLGPVNMMAVEQFDELESRHTFLTTQRQDLLDSIAATGEAIRKIDRTTRERFRDAFDAINANFQGTFTTLFGGGRAGLVLLDETDILESGIDIIAQPPGKRLQNVQLLSGGEKALTAIALMFGIFRYRPSPFCLLDEIDAPLDDANIGRFIEMLRGMQEHTQFILITHNRKTMEIADRLYGVTMEEPGVSKLISVRLN